jgi:hypothetical protein
MHTRLLIVLILLTVPTLAHAVSVQLDDGDKLVQIADVTVTGSATLIDSADSSRATLNCTNTSSSVHVRWGSSTVTAASGQQFRATSPIEIRNQHAVYMISEGASVVVACTKERR